MDTKIAKWGNSYAIRIPKEIIDKEELHEHSELEITHEDNQIILKKPTKQQRLLKLLESATPQQEMDWGAPRGKEYW